MTKTFNQWFNEIADIPHKDESGTWIDLEDGSTFIDWLQSSDNTQSSNRKYVSESCKKARETAKKIGGKALIGTKKQKEWAEEIRKEILDKIDDLEIKKQLCINNYFQHSALWISIKKNKKNVIKILNDINDLSMKANELLQSAESELKIDKNNIILEMGNYENIMTNRSVIIEKLNNIKYGNLNMN